MKNILLTSFDLAPFSEIERTDYEPAFEQAIVDAKNEIQQIIDQNEVPDFQNTIEAMAFSGMQLDRISNIFFNLNSAETSEELQKIAQIVAPKLSALANDISLNPDLFARVKKVYETVDLTTLTTEQKTLLDKTYKGFVRNGALLNEEDQAKLREMDAQLAVLSLKFNENVLAETNAYQLHITNEIDLEGLPGGAVEAANNQAEKQGLKGYVFTLDYPSYIPFVTYAKNRKFRKEITVANGKKGFQDNDFNNEQIVQDLVKLRDQRAKLLGYENHAAFVLEERMAQTPEKVLEFLNNLLEKAKPAAERELAELTAYAQKQDQIDRLERWDANYYSEKLKQERFQLDDEVLKPYFKLENVLNGAFEVAKRLYGLKFKEVHHIDKYHTDVQTFEVTNEHDDLTAVFYADFFPRKGKRNGAWMTSFKSQWIKGEVNQRPHISIVCNFTPPTSSKPSLLTFNEVTTLFHEFGHALHGMLANTTYPSLSGTSVYWDFVELPSQILENWVYEPETLALFAKHYETGATIPQEYIDKIKESSNFLEGLATVRQLSFGLLDMGWHTQVPDIGTGLKEFENQQFESTKMYPDVAENAMSTSFS
ncbi:MAG TPA: M3 family metallopeptidase, partial [Flavobacterium sp.]|nr:M3 family metallopeptidase [Flavobacterium sp.]